MVDGAPESGVDSADAAQRAFDRGDFREARRLALTLRDASDPAARETARAILSRTAIDPFIGWLTAGCLAFFVLVIVLSLR